MPPMVKQQRGPLLAFKIALTSLIMVNVVGLIAQFPTNSFVSRGNEPWQMFFFTFVPQNWAFFTKDPQSENLFVYSAERNYSSLLKTPQNKRENLWGVSRDQRAQGPEVARLAAEIPNSAWVKCDSDETSCLDSALDQERPQATIPNTALESSLCGKMIFGLGVPTPWSYRNLVEDKNRLTRASYVEVVCQ